MLKIELEEENQHLRNKLDEQRDKITNLTVEFNTIRGDRNRILKEYMTVLKNLVAQNFQRTLTTHTKMDGRDETRVEVFTPKLDEDSNKKRWE